MASFFTIQKRVKNLVGGNVSISNEEIQDLIRAEHEGILGDNSWTERKKSGTITTVAPYSTGTITTSGTTVTGVGTTFTVAMEGRWLRGDERTDFYKITDVASTVSMTIETAIGSGDISSASDYQIFQNVYTLPSDCERVISMTQLNRITEISRVDLDRIDPYRNTTGDTPRYYSYTELTDETDTASRIRQVEIYPIPSSAFLIRLQYLKRNDLDNSQDQPLYRSDVLVWKSGASAAFLLYAKTGDQAWKDLAQSYTEQYVLALQGARLDDIGKYSAATKIRDVLYNPIGSIRDDYYIDHDPFVP